MNNPKFSICCLEGKDELRHLKDPPQLLEDLLIGENTEVL